MTSVICPHTADPYPNAAPLAAISARLGSRRLGEYASTTPPESLQALRRMAQPLAGLRVLHLSAGPFGSATAEMLAGLVPLQQDLGIQAEWRIICGDMAQIGSILYEGLSGSPVRWGQRERRAWQLCAEQLASMLPAGYDVVVAHDPQVLTLARLPEGRKLGTRWIWHSHLDTAAAQANVWADLRGTLRYFSGALFPSKDLVPPDLQVPYCAVGRDALDLCSPKNLPLSREMIRTVLDGLGLDPDRPIIGQFAPIDQRYAPLTVLGAYWLVRREIPGIQVVLADPMPAFQRHVQRAAGQFDSYVAEDPNIHVLHSDAGMGLTELNALQQAVDIVLQLAVPRGFGWGLAECQWKGKPAVVGDHGRLGEQVVPDDDEGTAAGFIANDAPTAAAAILRLLQDRDLASRMGQAGRRRIMDNHSLAGLLADYFQLLQWVTDGEMTAVAR